MGEGRNREMTQPHKTSLIVRKNPIPKTKTTIPSFQQEAGPGEHSASFPATGRAFRLLRRIQDVAVPSHPSFRPTLSLGIPKA